VFTFCPANDPQECPCFRGVLNHPVMIDMNFNCLMHTAGCGVPHFDPKEKGATNEADYSSCVQSWYQPTSVYSINV
jgi:hypothetical protein